LIPIWYPEADDADEVTVRALEELTIHLPRIGDDEAGRDSSWDAGLQADALRGLLGQAYDSRLEEQTRQSWTAIDESGELAASAGLVMVAQTIEGRANHLYRRLLLDCPELKLDLGNPIGWARGRTPRWVAGRSARASSVPLGYWTALNQLSAAERKWATIAISVALKFPNDSSESRTGGMLLIDEPEAALHRSAEAYMARGLTALASTGLSVLVASHSPELLNADAAHVWHVNRQDKYSGTGPQVRPIGRVEADTLSELGLRPADLIGMQRGFLVVEGEHDEVVLRELIGDQLRDRRIHILPAYGVKRMQEAVSARVLYDFSDAHVFALVDAVELRTVRDAWEIAKQRRVGPDGRRAAVIEIESRFGGKNYEDRFLVEFMKLALESGVYDRQTPLSLPKTDILEYLDITYFLPNETSWDEVRRRAELELGHPPRSKEFKDWIRKQGARNRVTTPGIGKAAALLPEVPPDFAEILDAIDSVLERQKFQEEGL